MSFSELLAGPTLPAAPFGNFPFKQSPVLLSSCNALISCSLGFGECFYWRTVELGAGLNIIFTVYEVRDRRSPAAGRKPRYKQVGKVPCKGSARYCTGLWLRSSLADCFDAFIAWRGRDGAIT